MAKTRKKSKKPAKKKATKKTRSTAKPRKAAKPKKTAKSRKATKGRRPATSRKAAKPRARSKAPAKTAKRTKSARISPTAKLTAFTLDAPSGWLVCIAGSFNGWEPQGMTKGADGLWRITVPLEPGSYEYKFLVDTEWRDDPNNPQRRPNEFGGFNSICQVP